MRERGLRIRLNQQGTLKAERRETRRWRTWIILRHGVHRVGPLLGVNLTCGFEWTNGYRSYGSSGVALFDRCDLPIQIPTDPYHMFSL